MEIRPSFMWGACVAAALLALQFIAIFALLAAGTPPREIANGLSLGMRLIPVLLPLLVPLVLFAVFWGVIAVVVYEAGRSLFRRQSLTPKPDDVEPR